MRKIILSFAACLALAAYGQKPVQDTRAMDTFIDQLMGKMTLDEKIGQLNLSGGGVPGILSGSEGADETIRRGWLGATGGSELETFRKLQEIAVKESRLGIPLLFGLDVIHGYDVDRAKCPYRRYRGQLKRCDMDVFPDGGYRP